MYPTPQITSYLASYRPGSPPHEGARRPHLLAKGLGLPAAPPPGAQASGRQPRPPSSTTSARSRPAAPPTARDGSAGAETAPELGCDGATASERAERAAGELQVGARRAAQGGSRLVAFRPSLRRGLEAHSCGGPHRWAVAAGRSVLPAVGGVGAREPGRGQG